MNTAHRSLVTSFVTQHSGLSERCVIAASKVSDSGTSAGRDLSHSTRLGPDRQMSQMPVLNRTLPSTCDHAVGRLRSEVTHFGRKSSADRIGPSLRLSLGVTVRGACARLQVGGGSRACRTCVAPPTIAWCWVRQPTTGGLPGKAPEGTWYVHPRLGDTCTIGGAGIPRRNQPAHWRAAATDGRMDRVGGPGLGKGTDDDQVASKRALDRVDRGTP
jgi:hypothetical protein